MLKQKNLIGFDSKCIDCGNYYAADYIEFHQKERCLKTNLNSSNTSSTNSDLKQNDKKPPNIQPSKPNPISVTNVSQRSKTKAKIRCLYCSSLVKSHKYQNHIDLKCPKKNQLKKKTSKPIDSIPKSLIECKHCKFQISRRKYENHLARLCPQVKIRCPYCREILIRSNFQQHLLLKHNESLKNRAKPTKDQIDAFMGKPSISNGTNSNSGIYIKRLALKNSSVIRGCRICGRPAMYNSPHCYSCGDK